MTAVFDDKKVLILGGTGSLGSALTKSLLSGKFGLPSEVIVFSRDEAKQHEMRVSYLGNLSETDSVTYRFAKERLKLVIGDVRNSSSVKNVVSDADVIVYAAAMKQVPACEYHPWEAVQTNVLGLNNVLEAIQQSGVQTLVGVSTDKAVMPVNVMGMSKAIQERLVIKSNLVTKSTRAVVVRYGNVIASRGSVIPLFKDQLARGIPITLTDSAMTRFLLTLDDAVEIIVKAVDKGIGGDTFIPAAPSARIIDLIEVLAEGRKTEIVEIGRRPGEKVHELLFSEEEGLRTLSVDEHSYRILPSLPEFQKSSNETNFYGKEFSSADHLMSKQELVEFLKERTVI